MVLILSILFVALATILEARQDYWIIKDTKALYRNRWKLWGNAYSMFLLGGLAFIVHSTTQNHWLLFILLHVIYAFVWWVMHDMAIGVFLKGNPFYLGTTGWDAWVRKIFHSGARWVLYRLIILVILCAIYFPLWL